MPSSGKNWMGDKITRGDDATPEGRYRITKKASERLYKVS